MILAPPGGREELDYVRHIVKQTIDIRNNLLTLVFGWINAYER